MALSKRLTYQGDLLVNDTLDEVSMADGAYSWLFDGNTQQVTVPHNTVLNFSNSDWTIEFWALPTSTDNLVGGRLVFSKRSTSAAYASILIGHNGGSGYWEFYISNATGVSPWFVISTTSITADVGVWQHIALVRRGPNINAYKNGVRVILTTTMSTNIIFDDGSPVIVGGLAANIPVQTTNSFGAYRYRGYLSNFRVTKGSALYTDATVTIPSAPMVSQGSVTSLLTCQSSTFKDNSSYAHALYDSNTPVISYKNPFTPEKSVYFNGASSYLRYADNAAFQFGTGNFTIEAWVYLTSSTFASTQKRIWSYQAAGAATVLWIGVTNALKLSAEMRNSTGTNDIQITGTTTIQLNTWYHVAFVRSGTTASVYLNGLLEATNASMNQSIASGNPAIGAYYNTSGVGTPGDFWSGYISNLRIVKGTALYTSSGGFTVPTAPLPIATGISLLTCQGPLVRKDSSTNNFALSNIIDNPSVSDLNPFGSSVLTNETSVPVAQRQTNSVSFVENQYQSLTIGTSSSLALGAGNFTVEGWIYPTEWNTNTSVFFDYRTNGGAATSIPALTFSATGVPQFYINPGSTVTISGSTIPTLNAWNHLALVRSGSTVTMYLNGTSIGTATSSATLGIQTLAINNVQSFANYNQAGYFSNFRIVVGTAVYTGTFTPPTSPLQTTQSAGTNIAAITDPSQVRLLTCQEYGEFTDNSPYNWTITTLPTALTTTVRDLPTTSTFSPFGTYQNPTLTNNYYSTLFNGTSQYLSVPNSAGSALGTTTDFTFEAWIYPTTLAYGGGGLSDNNTVIGAYGTTGTITGYFFGFLNTGALYFSSYVTGTKQALQATNNFVTANTWNHIAVTRSGSTYRMFVNGVSVTFTGSITQSLNTSNPINIGGLLYTTYYDYLTGYISNLRIINGTAVYTSNFTPSTAPLTAIAGTQLLTCQSPVIQDNSTTPFSITNTGTVTVDTFNPFRISVNTYSYVFNGTTKYLSTPTNAAFDFGTGDFTIELWAYKNTSSTNDLIITNRSLVAGALPGRWYLDTYLSKIRMVFQNTSSVDYEVTNTGSIDFPVGEWFHLAAVKSGSTITGYLNGSSFGSISVSGSFGTTASGVYIGSFTNDATWAWNGYISTVRIVKGTAVYTSNFIPSTTRLSAISGTSLLTCESSQAIDKSLNGFTITNTGSVTTSSTVTPVFTSPTYTQPEFPVSRELPSGVLMTKSYLDDYSNAAGRYAVYFGGSGNYLSTPSSTSFDFGTNDFTIEAWIYPTDAGRTADTSKYGAIITQYVSASITNAWYFGIGISGGVFSSVTFTSSDVTRVTATGLSYALNTWHHVACVRYKGTITIYINGVSVGSASYLSAISYNASASVQIARSGYGGTYENWLKGSISNLRVVKGVAVYTSNFSTKGLYPLTPVSGTSLLTCQNSTIRDNSSNAFTLTSTGSVPTNAIEASLYYASFGTGNYLYAPSDAAFQLSTSDFTIEMWIRITAIDSYAVLLDMRNGTTNAVAPQIYLGSGVLYYHVSNANRITGPTLITNTWYHVAFSRNNSVTRMFVNGSQVGSDYADTNNYIINSPKIAVASGLNGTGYLTGSISNLRIVKGTGLYASKFTPSTQTLTAINNTVLLTCHAATLIDGSTNNFSLTSTGSITVSPPLLTSTTPPVASRIYPTGVTEIGGWLDDYSGFGQPYVYFNGTNYLTSGSNAALTLGTGDFTVEHWVKIPDWGNSNIALGFIQMGSGGFSTQCTGNGALFQMGRYGFGSQGPTASLKAGVWYHLAICRIAGDAFYYVNGAYIGSVLAFTTDFTGTTCIIGDFGRGRTGSLGGYMSNFRIVKGAGIYTGAFTPPTSPLQTTQSAGTNIASITDPTTVSILTCQSSYFVDNSTYNRSITPSSTTNSPTILTKASPF